MKRARLLLLIAGLGLAALWGWVRPGPEPGAPLSGGGAEGLAEAVQAAVQDSDIAEIALDDCVLRIEIRYADRHGCTDPARARARRMVMDLREMREVTPQRLAVSVEGERRIRHWLAFALRDPLEAIEGPARDAALRDGPGAPAGVYLKALEAGGIRSHDIWEGCTGDLSLGPLGKEGFALGLAEPVRSLDLRQVAEGCRARE